MYTTLLFYLPFLMFFVLITVFFERRIAALIQRRLGPNTTGYKGLGQTTADLIKLLQKEWILPYQVNRYLFYLLPCLLFIVTFSVFAVFPVHSYWQGSTLWGVIYIFFVLAIEIIFIICIGWFSQNQYAFLASFRTAAQMVAYEVPCSICIIMVVYFAGSVDLQTISIQQGIFSSQEIYLWGIKMLGITVHDTGGFLAWHILQCPLLFLAYIVFFITSLAICKRAPFDLPESESELISGYHIEYTGVHFALIMFVEYSNMFLMSMLGVILFLGSWNTPIPNIGNYPFAQWTSGIKGHFSAALWGIFWLMLKTFLIVFITIWIRWSLPRLRYDQLIFFCWHKLIPYSLLLFTSIIIWSLFSV